MSLGDTSSWFRQNSTKWQNQITRTKMFSLLTCYFDVIMKINNNNETTVEVVNLIKKLWLFHQRKGKIGTKIWCTLSLCSTQPQKNSNHCYAWELDWPYPYLQKSAPSPVSNHFRLFQYLTMTAPFLSNLNQVQQNDKCNQTFVTFGIWLFMYVYMYIHVSAFR